MASKARCFYCCLFERRFSCMEKRNQTTPASVQRLVGDGIRDLQQQNFQIQEQ